MIRPLRRTLGRGSRPAEAQPDAALARLTATAATGPEIDIAPTGPLLAYLAAAPSPVDVLSLDLDSQVVPDLRAVGVVFVVPLIS